MLNKNLDAVCENVMKEGYVREIIRAINQIRKEQKLTINDEVTVEYQTDDELLLNVFKDFTREIKKNILAKELIVGKNLTSEEIKIDNKLIELIVKN